LTGHLRLNPDGGEGSSPEVAAYSGHSLRELDAVAAGDGRLRTQTTLAVELTCATGAPHPGAAAALQP
jgi:hypothetical protein